MSDITFKVTSDFKLDRPSLDHFLNDPSGEIGQELAKRGRRIIFAAKKQVGKDTRELERSIHMIHQRIGGIQQLWIGSDNDIAYLHHEGSRPHAIQARNVDVLRFRSGGRMVYAREVMHPGTDPNRYLSDNLYLAYV